MITIVKPDSSYSRHNLTVKCPCGRTLRAKIELAGTEVQCWDCHRKVPVPFPRAAHEALEAFRKSWDDVFETNLFPTIVIAAVVLTAMLATPAGLGIPLGVVGLVLAAWSHGELIRRARGTTPADGGDLQESRVESPVSWPRWAARAAAALVFGVALSTPYWLLHTGNGQRMHVPGFVAPLIVAAAMAVMPLATLAAFNPAGPSVVAAALRWRPRAVLASLALLPLAVVGLELALLFVSFFLGILGGFMIDIVPVPAAVLVHWKVPRDWIFHFGIPTDVSFLGVYADRLLHGYTLAGAIPPSLPRPRLFYSDYWASDLEQSTYFYIRFALTILIYTGFLSALAFQACCLGRIGILEARILALRPTAPAEAPVTAAVLPTAPLPEPVAVPAAAPVPGEGAAASSPA